MIDCCLTSVGAAAGFDRFDGLKPIAMSIQSNPWVMVVGSNTPRVAIYENGDIIFAKKVDDRLVYQHVTLDKDELENVRQQLRPVLRLKGLEPRYNIRPNVTDQPEAMFFLRDGEQEVATSVEGLLAAGTKVPAYTEFPNGAKPGIPPDGLLQLHTTDWERIGGHAFRTVRTVGRALYGKSRSVYACCHGSCCVAARSPLRADAEGSNGVFGKHRPRAVVRLRAVAQERQIH